MNNGKVINQEVFDDNVNLYKTINLLQYLQTSDVMLSKNKQSLLSYASAIRELIIRSLFVLKLCFCLTNAFCQSGPSSIKGNTDKKQEKDTTLYKVIMENKDTLLYGIDRTRYLLDSSGGIIGSFKIKGKSVVIQFSEKNTEICSIHLDIQYVKADTVQVFAPEDLTKPDFLKFVNNLYGEVSMIHVTDYKAIARHPYLQRLMAKLFPERKNL